MCVSVVAAPSDRFQECARYLTPEQISEFLDKAIRNRIAVRLIAEQHIAISRDLAHGDGERRVGGCPEERWRHGGWDGEVGMTFVHIIVVVRSRFDPG